MKYYSKISIAVLVLLLLVGTFTLYRNNQELKNENERLAGIVNISPQRSSEVFIDSIEVPVYKTHDTLITKYKVINRYKQKSVRESSIPVTYMDSVAKALRIGEKAVTRLTRLNASLNKKLEKKDLRINKLEKQVWHWETNNAKVVTNLKDSTAIVKYNAQISVTDFDKRESWFSKKKHYTAVSTDDPDLTINGVQSFEKELNMKCSKFNLSGYAGYGLQLNNGLVNVGPQVGIGLTYDLF